MRGEVEIRCGDKVLLKESNLIVDGAGSLFADIMTAPRWCEDITEVSSILDTSNYTIQAISFGKGKDGYVKNAHEVIDTKTQYFVSNGAPAIISTKDQADVLDSDTSSIIWGVSSLPASPNPQNTKLNLNCYTTTGFTLDYGGLPIGLEFSKDMKDDFSDFGQNLNALPTSISTELFSGPKFSNFTDGVEAYLISIGVPLEPFNYIAPASGIVESIFGSHLGCWPAGSTEGGTPFYVFSSIDSNDFGNNSLINKSPSAGVYDASTGFYAQSGTLNGYFNEASSMDYKGYCTMVTGTDSTQGLTLSTNADYADTGEIIYQVTMASGDAIAAQLYGGIFNFGLWAIDINESLKAGNQPPLQFDVINNQRKYKLFARKDLSRSFTLLHDTYDSVGGTHYPATLASAPEVTITWKIYFL